MGKEGGRAKELSGVCNIVFTWLNLLLVFVPLGFMAQYRKWGSAMIFSFNFIAIVPLAGILGAATESLAIHTGQLLGGLLNATFGNAVEMIVTVQALNANLVSVVQGSLLGSILSNLLLVLGMAFFCGGVVYKEQKFSAAGADTSVQCLILSSIALSLPTIFHHHPGVTEEDVVTVSGYAPSSLVVSTSATSSSSWGPTRTYSSRKRKRRRRPKLAQSPR